MIPPRARRAQVNSWEVEASANKAHAPVEAPAVCRGTAECSVLRLSIIAPVQGAERKSGNGPVRPRCRSTTKGAHWDCLSPADLLRAGREVHRLTLAYPVSPARP